MKQKARNRGLRSRSAASSAGANLLKALPIFERRVDPERTCVVQDADLLASALSNIELRA
jgi:hypothetical protein